MCGIAGIIDYHSPIDKTDAEKMLQSMTNRGPDDEGVYISPNSILLHKRLAVVDVKSSIQPMTKKIDTRTYTIVYNGELYNTDEIRAKLQNMGYTFLTKGDTEIVLLSYIAFGEDCVNLFNGIFAFAIWEEYSQKLFFARDVMGVKPFFYSLSEGAFIFASAIPALLCNKKVKSTIDTTSVCEIMLLGPGRTPSSGVFTMIKELPRAHAGTFDSSGLKIYEYFALTDKPHTDDFEKTAKTVNMLVTDAIKRQLVSDVPIGTFLSGGLDSSIISAVASEEMKKQGKSLDTFSVTYKDQAKHFKSSHFQPDSDEEYIEMMVKHINSNHHEVVLDTSDIISALYPVIDEKGVPSMADVDSSLLLFCKEIKKHVTVALSGECADEYYFTC